MLRPSPSPRGRSTLHPSPRSDTSYGRQRAAPLRRAIGGASLRRPYEEPLAVLPSGAPKTIVGAPHAIDAYLRCSCPGPRACCARTRAGAARCIRPHALTLLTGGSVQRPYEDPLAAPHAGRPRNQRRRRSFPQPRARYRRGPRGGGRQGALQGQGGRAEQGRRLRAGPRIGASRPAP
jgi:hypothetical protein